MGDCLVSRRRVVSCSNANNKMDLLHNKKEIIMSQYIPKDVVVAIIKHHIKEETHSYFCKCLLSEIDTIEVKELDDEPECKIFPRPAECYSTCKGCPYAVTNNKVQKGE